jgi:HEPN domain-containing protein
MASAAYADVVRESQEVVELILKGTLRFIGVDPPKRHDVRAVLLRFRDRLPAEWREAMEEIGEASTELAQERAHAFYGDESEIIPASELFGEGDARRALVVVDRLMGLYGRLLGEG